jgi:hypothetical protein
MTPDYLTLGPVPSEETCAALGIDPDFPEKSRRECRVFKRLLQRLFPVPQGVDAPQGQML